MNLKKTYYCLGTSLINHKVYLYYRPYRLKNNFFQIDTSSNGINFKIYSQKGRILKGKRQPVNIKNCSDFRISSLEKGYFLTYKLATKGQTFLHGAFSHNLIDWGQIGRLADLKTSGMVVPNYKYQGKYILYAGDQSLKIALSSNLKNWKVSTSQFFPQVKDKTKGLSIKIGNLILVNQGILLAFYTLKGKDFSKNYSLNLALFDKKNPKKLLWQSQEPIWQQSNELPKKIQAIGVVKLDNQLLSYWQSQDGEIFTLSHSCPLPFLKYPKMAFFAPLLKKFKDNPIIKPISDHFWESKAVFNPAAVYEKGKVHLVYRAVGDTDVSVLGYATSKDGVRIDERLKSPIYTPRKPFEGTRQKKPSHCSRRYMSGGGGCGGCEDPRITKINGRFYMTYVAYDGQNPPRVALTSIAVDDFLNQNWNWDEPVLISLPGVVDKNASLLSEKINGKYVFFHRIYPDILIDFVESLEFDGKTFLQGQFAIKPRKYAWDSLKVGLGPPPIKTDAGWLAIYQAVDAQDSSRYKMGAMLLDLENPAKVLYRSGWPILEPDKPYENEGYKSGVAYSCGAVTLDDRLYVYYGGADMVVCLATASLPEFLGKLKSSGRPKLETWKT